MLPVCWRWTNCYCNVKWGFIKYGKRTVNVASCQTTKIKFSIITEENPNTYIYNRSFLVKSDVYCITLDLKSKRGNNTVIYYLKYWFLHAPLHRKINCCQSFKSDYFWMMKWKVTLFLIFTFLKDLICLIIPSIPWIKLLVGY